MKEVNLVSEVEKYSGFTLKRKEDLEMIINESSRIQNTSLLDEIAFTAKYLQGLMRILKSQQSNIDFVKMESIRQDFSDNILKVTESLRNVFAESDPRISAYFEQNYFQKNQSSFQNLTELLSDLEWLKKYLNEQKRLRTN
jgi:hypothetical protein